MAKTLLKKDYSDHKSVMIVRMRNDSTIVVHITLETWKILSNGKSGLSWSVVFGKHEEDRVAAIPDLHPENFKLITDTAFQMIKKHHEAVFEGQSQ